MSHPPPNVRRGRKADARGSARQNINALNPYSLDANGWCEPSEHRAQAYDRSGPPADPRAAVDEAAQTNASKRSESRATLEKQLDELRKAEPRAIDVEKLFKMWSEHPRREVIAPMFPALKGSERRTALRREVGRVRVRSARGDVVDLASKVKDCPALTPIESQRIMDAVVDLRHAWKTRDVKMDGGDAGYDEVNWRHACQEIGQILDVAEESRLSPLLTEDAVLASLFSDAAKLKKNFLTHHIDGAVAAALVLPRFLDVGTAGGRARIVAICQAILEHQVGPPRFMAQMVRMGIEEQLREGKRSDVPGDVDALLSLHKKIADPLNARHTVLHQDGYGVLNVDARETELLSLVGLPAWYAPHPLTPWFMASSAVIDADSLVNYVTPDGVGKIVAICGPGTPFHDPTVFHSIFSCGASFVDAVSVMSDTAMSAMREGVQQTRAAIDDVRARMLAEIEEGWLHFAPAEFRKIVDEEGVDVEQLTSTKRDGEILIDVPWEDGGNLPYWNTSLDYANTGAAYEFAKLLRRRVADLLREA